MKTIIFSRNQIVRAIRAACFALFLAAAAKSQAAPVTAMSDGNGNVTLAGGPGNYSYDGTNPNLAVNGILTVQAGANITNATNQGYIISLSNGATVNNNGTLTFGPTTASGQLGYNLVSVIDNAGNAITITNSATGSLTSNANGSNSGEVVVAFGHGAVTIQNNGGSITGSSYYDGRAVSAVSTAANVLVTNSGSISDTTTGMTGDSSAASYGIYANSQAAAGTVTVNNSGTVSGSSAFDIGAGIYATTASGLTFGTGPITITNTGSSTGSNYGINAQGGNAITITNTGNGTTTGLISGNTDGILANSTTGNVSVTNTGGAISGDTGVSAATANAGTLLFSNTGNGAITGTSFGVSAVSGAGLLTLGNDLGSSIITNSSGDTVAVQAQTLAGGAISITNGGTISATTGNMQGTGSGNATGIYGLNDNDGGNVTVLNSGSVSSSSNVGSSHAIDVQLQLGDIQITNNAGASIDAASGYGNSRGLFLSTDTGLTTVANAGTITASSYETAFGIYSQGGGATSITNSATGIISASNTDADGAQTAIGVYASNDQDIVTVTNFGAISGTGVEGLAAGVQVQANGDVVVTNQSTGVITGTGSNSANAAGVLLQSGEDDATVNNSNAITSSSVDGTSRGVDIETGDAITINNFATGTITSTTTGGGDATGINTNSSSNGAAATTITNNGSVTASATGSGSAYGIGSSTHGSGTLTITNTNNVSATSDNGFAYGIATNATATGQIVIQNTGTVTASGSYITFGVVGGGVDGNVSITNSAAATISATSTIVNPMDAPGLGFGILATSGGAGNVSVTNMGTIMGSSASVSASGITANTESGTGSVTIANTGSIQATNTGTGTEGVSASGIYAESTNGGITITNSGTGTVNVHSTTSALGIGGFSDGAGIVSIVNTSTGLVNATSSSIGTDSVSGIYSYSESASAYLRNTGQVTASGGTASTLLAQGAIGTTIINSGTLTATSASGQYAAGILGENTTTGTLAVTNSAYISSTGSNSYGMHLLGDNGSAVTVTNSGQIVVSADNFGSGIYAQTSGGPITITNSADVSTTGAGTNSGIYATVHDTAANIVITNTATGAANGSSTNDDGYVYGIAGNNLVGGNVTVTNNGVASATANYVAPFDSYLGDTYAYGIYTNAMAAGTILITNTGTAVATNSEYENKTFAIYAQSASGAITINNSGMATAQTAGDPSVYTEASASGIYAESANGNIVITNSGSQAVCGLGTGSDYGISAYSSGSGNVSIVNTDSALVLAAGSANGDTVSGIYADSNSGSAFIRNTGPVTATGGESEGLSAEGSTGATVINSGAITANSATGQYGYGIVVENFGTGDFGLTNSGTVTVSGDTASGLYAYGSLPLVLSNSGAITVTGTGIGSASGIYTDVEGNVNLTNMGAIIAAGPGPASGIFATSYGTPSTITVTNSGNVEAESSSVTATASGIYGYSAGNLVINNAGLTFGLNDSGGAGYGISAASGGGMVAGIVAEGILVPDIIEGGLPNNGNIVVNNTGIAAGTTAGIYLADPGIVNNSGTAAGLGYSIYVPTDSTVNLIKTSPIFGLLKGGADDTSNSLLNFNITVRTNYAGTKANLDAAIASYDTAYALANGDGNDVTSNPVDINDSTYQWQDFKFVEDNLVQARLYAQTPGFRSLGSAIDGFDPTNPSAALIFSALDALPSGAVADALAQLSPKELQIFRNVAFDNNTFNAAKINNHLANLRDGLTGFDTTQLTVNDPSMDSSLNQVRSHLLAYDPAATPGLLSDSEATFGGMDTKDMKSAQVNTMPVDRWSAFISGDVILADLSNNTNVPDSNYTTGNVMAGVDYRLDQHFTVGALFAYAHTGADLDSRGSSATVDSYSPGIYASYVNKEWYGNALATYGRNSYTEDRNINIPGLEGTNHGGTSGNQATGNLTGGYEFQRGPFKFGPVASVQYVHLNIDSMQESGSPTSLSLNEQNQDSLRTLLGVEARYVTDVNTPMGRTTLTPHVSASWQHEYLDNSQGITSQFNSAGGGSFATQTDNPDRDSAFLDIGLDATLSKNVTVFIDYEAQAGQSDFFAQSAQGGVRIGF